MKNVIPTLLLILGFSLVQSQNYNANENDINKILKNKQNLSEYIMTSDYDNIAALYTKKAKIFPNEMNILEGNDIKKSWTLPEGLKAIHYKIIKAEITVVDNTAYDYGNYEGKTKNTKGDEHY